MGYNDDEDFEGFEDDNGQQNTMAEVRKWGKAQAKLAKELEQKLADANLKLAQSALKDVLQGKNLNPGFAKWIVADGVDASDEKAVDAWLSDNAALIGYKPASPDESGAPDERAAAFAKMQEAQAGALPNGKLDDLAARLAKVDGNDIDAVQAILAEAQRAAPVQ